MQQARRLWLKWYKAALFVLIGIPLFFVLAYLVIFGRVLRQQENHLAIALALPKVLLGSEAVPIDESAYLSRDTDAFVRAMQKEGFTHTDQLGSGYVFGKDGKRYLSTSRMYSSHLRIFTYPSL